MHRGGSAIDALESALGDWPAPAVVTRPRPALRRAAEAVRLGAPPPAVGRLRRAGRSASCCWRTATRCSGRSPAWPAPTCGPGGSPTRPRGPRRWRAMTETIPICAPCWSRRPSPTPRRPTTWRWPAASCRGSTFWAGPRPTPPIRWWRFGCSRRASGRTPPTWICSSSTATSRACCRLTSWPSGGSKRRRRCSRPTRRRASWRGRSRPS